LKRKYEEQETEDEEFLERYTRGVDVQAILQGIEVFGNGEEASSNLYYKRAFWLLAYSSMAPER